MKKREKKVTGALVLIGSAADCPDLEYASGFRPVDAVVYVETPARRVLVVPELEYGRAVRESLRRGAVPGHPAAPVEVLTPKRLGLGKHQRRRLSGWAVAVLQAEGVRRVTVPARFPHGVAVRVQRAGIRVTVAKTEMFPQRAVKTPDEQRRIREAQQAAVIAMRTAITAISDSEIGRDGVLRTDGKPLTSESVRRRIVKTLVEHDCFCKETIVAGGRQAADPHETGHGPLRAHEPIVIDIFPQHIGHGYWGDMTRTVVRGRAAPRLRRMYLAVKAAQAEALAGIRPGARCSAVHARAEREFKRRGFTTGTAEGKSHGFIHSTGHGVGLEVHEGPSLGPVEGTLRAGNVVTVEPGLYYPDFGGVRIEDTVVVTAQGWRYLVPCEKRLEV